MKNLGLSVALSALGCLASIHGAQADDGCCDTGCEGGCDPFGLVSCDSAPCDIGCDFDMGCDGVGCDGCSSCGCLDDLADTFGCGLIKKSDHCFDDFISPMINFVFFEDPRNLTELRPIFLTHNVPGTIGAGVPAGGSVQLYAMQFRAALTERLSLIAVKDGFIVDNTEGALDGLIDDGWADVSLGLKYNLLRDVQSGTLLSTGFTYELPIGSQRALQDIGDGEFHIFATGGQRLLNGNAHILSSVGYRLPVDTDLQTSAIHWSNHFDVRLLDKLYLFTEVAWWHFTDDAGGPALGITGQDIINLPFGGMEGNDLVTQNVGVKVKPTGNFEAGIAYEFPLTEFKDIIEDRLQV